MASIWLCCSNRTAADGGLGPPVTQNLSHLGIRLYMTIETDRGRTIVTSATVMPRLMAASRSTWSVTRCSRLRLIPRRDLLARTVRHEAEQTGDA